MVNHSPVRRWGGEPQPSWGGGPSPRRGAPLPLPSRGFESVEHSHIVDVSFGHHVLAHHLLVGHGYVARVARAAIVREERLAGTLILFLGCDPRGRGHVRPCRRSGLLLHSHATSLRPRLVWLGLGSSLIHCGGSLNPLMGGGAC